MSNIGIWVSSDYHFNHNKDFIWQARGFNSIQEMNETILNNHNLLISDNDDVYLLGDIMLGDSVESIKYVEQLKGKLHIILGNHDTTTRQVLYSHLKNVVEIRWANMLTVRKFHFFLSHFPCNTSNIDDGKKLTARTWNLCGHTHTTNPFLEMEKGISSYHVEVDAHECRPLSIDEIIDDISRRSFL